MVKKFDARIPDTWLDKRIRMGCYTPFPSGGLMFTNTAATVPEDQSLTKAQRLAINELSDVQTYLVFGGPDRVQVWYLRSEVKGKQLRVRSVAPDGKTMSDRKSII